MPPINREQVRRLQQRGAIDEQQAALWLSRLNAGQTVDVSASLLSQAEPERLPSPIQRAAETPAARVASAAILAGLFGIPGPALEQAGIEGGVREGLLDVFRGARNPAFQPAQAAPPLTAAETIFAHEGGVQPPVAEQAEGAPTGGSPDLTQAFTGAGGPLQLQPVIGPDGQPIPGLGQDPTSGNLVPFETAEQRVQRIADENRQRATTSPQAQREQAFLERQRGITDEARRQRFVTSEREAAQQAAVEAENRALLRQQLAQPGGEFLARALRQRGMGLTPVFNPERDLRSLSPSRFEELFSGPRQEGSAIPSTGVAGLPAIQAALSNQAALEGGGVAATGATQFADIPNISQITGLNDAELAELAAVLPQLTGQSLEDVERRSRRLAPPRGAGFTAAFR